MKELFQLTRMLFTSKPGDFGTPQLLAMKHYPFKGNRFMMWCGRMIYRADNAGKIEKYMQTYAYVETFTHETIHLRQAQKAGSWVKYYWKYFCEWIKGNPVIAPASSAYYTIPYEMEAYANQHNPDYAARYTGEFLHCYDIRKHRKQIYRSYGRPSNEWLKYLRSIKKV